MEIGSTINILRGLPEKVVLKPGDLLNVKVLKVFENQCVLVDLCRCRSLAEITFPVEAGDELKVRVQETQGQLRLQLIPPSSDPASKAGSSGGPVLAAAAASLKKVQVRIDQMAGAMQRLPDAQQLPKELRQAADALRVFLEPLDRCSSPEALAHKLREFCEHSGLFLEHRLAAVFKRAGGRAGEAPPAGGSTETLERILSTDLKSRLLVLKTFLENMAGRTLIHENREVAALAGAATELLADIRAGQEQLGKSAALSPPFQMVHFALPTADDRCRTSLKIAYGRQTVAGKDQGHRAAILLDLDRMGAVRADLVLLGSSLNVAVFVSTIGVRDLVNRHASEIREALASIFEHVAFQVSVSSRKIARFMTEDWRTVGESQVDVRV